MAAVKDNVKMDPTEVRRLAIEIDVFNREVDSKASNLVRSAADLSKTLDKQIELSARAPSEQLVLRAGVSHSLSTLAAIGAAQANNLKGTAGMPSAENLIEILHTEFASTDKKHKLDFSRLGLHASRLMFDVPTMRPFLGTMTIPLKESKPKQAAKVTQRQKDDHASEKPKEVGEDEAVVEEAKNARRATEIFDSLRKYMLSKAGDETSGTREIECEDGMVRTMIPMVHALFDPYSYSQTVENIFYFSFLVKQQFAGIFLAKERAVPYVWIKDVGTVTSAGTGAAPTAASQKSTGDKSVLQFRAKQFILQIDPDSWHRICQHNGLKSPMVLPHRRSKDSIAPADYEPHDDTAKTKHTSGTKRAFPGSEKDKGSSAAKKHRAES